MRLVGKSRELFINAISWIFATQQKGHWLKYLAINCLVRNWFYAFDNLRVSGLESLKKFYGRHTRESDIFVDCWDNDKTLIHSVKQVKGFWLRQFCQLCKKLYYLKFSYGDCVQKYENWRSNQESKQYIVHLEILFINDWSDHNKP